jgi:hypothetical protein
MQTVYHPHTPDISVKILRAKELVQVENVPASSVRTKTEQRWERRAQPGLKLSGHGGIRHTNDYHIRESMLSVFFRWYLNLLTYDIVWIRYEPLSLHNLADS